MRQFRKLGAFHSITAILLTGCLWLTLAAAVQAGSGVLLYNKDNGAVTYGTIYADGHFLTTAYYPPGSFATDWTHIVRANNGLLFFFRQTDGLWATVQADQYGNLTTLQQGYTNFYEPDTRKTLHVVNTPNGILMCRPAAGYEYTSRGGLIGQVRNDGYFQITHRPNFSQWTNVVNTPNGVFFLSAHNWVDATNRNGGPFAVGRIQPNGIFLQTQSGILSQLDGGYTPCIVTAIGNNLILQPHVNVFGLLSYLQINGFYRVGSVNSNGQFALGSNECSPILAGGFINPFVLGNDLLLYAASDAQNHGLYVRPVNAGWASVSTFRTPSTFLNTSCWNKLRIKQEYPDGSFAPGWKTILYTTDGTLFYNPDSGAALVGKFDTNGAFTPLHDLPSWLDPGYSHVLKVTQ